MTVELATAATDVARPRNAVPAGNRARRTAATGHALRALVVVSVLALLVGGTFDAATSSRVLELSDDAATDAAALVRATFGAPDAALLVRRSADPPDAHVLDALAASGAVAPLLATLPAPPSVTAHAPRRLIAERAAAIAFEITGTAGTQERVELRDAGGAVIDSTGVQLDGSGRASGAFRVRPLRAGWHEWRIATRSGERRTGGWALPARAPRVLVAAGPPDAESRFVVRALEEAGASVELRQPLGRGLTLGGAAIGLPDSPESLRQTDVVIVLHGAVRNDAQRLALARFAEEHGGGVLVAARDPVLQGLGLAEAAQPDARAVSPAAVQWDMPAELLALPAVAGSGDAGSGGSVEPIRAAAGATVAAWLAERADGAAAGAAPARDAVLVLRAAGRGRAAALGLRESWRWRVAGGSTDEHRAFWRSLVDWLAPLNQPVQLDFAAPVVATGLPVRAELEYEAGFPNTRIAALPLLLLRRPGGVVEQLPVQRTGAGWSHAHVSFVPADTGVHILSVADDTVVGAVRAVAHTAHEPAAELALVAHASGGRALPADALRDSLHALGAARARVSWRSVAFGLVLLAALADWALRRLRGAS